MSQPTHVERWGIYELALPGPTAGNPFVDVSFGARFSFKNRTIDADGFYDGDGVYRVRCMPNTEGEWQYVTHSNVKELDGVSGIFFCTPAAPANHGPVVLRNTYHFAYADGTPYFQVGTTCYAWNHQGDALEQQTLKTLAAAPFNKLRMCIFPKHYAYNANEPEYFVFERAAAGGWDFTRFSPAYFHHLERLLAALCDLNIEADLILFHPYDRWGFAAMDAATDDRYLRYVVARLAAFRNVWWSMANEWDLMKAKTMADWDRFFRIVQECDPYQHPRSIHNCFVNYDHGKPWVTHCSIQRWDVENTREWRNTYKKPVIVDECRYEGDIPQFWGCITAEEMVRRFWESAVRGGYCGHGETYLHPEDILWWAKGGLLRGQSPSRLAFFRRILEEGPSDGHEPIDGAIETRFPCAGKPGEYYLTYTGIHQPRQLTFLLPDNARFHVDVIDTWTMTITPLSGVYSGRCTVHLPGKPYIAVRIRRADT